MIQLLDYAACDMDMRGKCQKDAMRQFDV